MTSEIRSDGVFVERFVVDGVFVPSNNIAVDMVSSYRAFPTKFRIETATPIRNPARFLLLFACGKRAGEDLELIQNNLYYKVFFFN